MGSAAAEWMAENFPPSAAAAVPVATLRITLQAQGLTVHNSSGAGAALADADGEGALSELDKAQDGG